ncbi:phosphatase PAP2 family protein [Oxalobacteraceae bacterium OTU3CINTB1]|nr:phosphatase PAP2 family protein [Oxalobacteraceae bacterium OTU3CINTB1]
MVFAVSIFGHLASEVMGQEEITVLDLHIANWFNANHFEPMTSIMMAITTVHTMPGVILMASAFGYFLWKRGQIYWIWALVLSVPCGMLLNVLLKVTFQRSRPVFEEPLVTLATYSFPSGHASAATLFYGLVACYVMIARKGWSVRLGTAAACTVMILLVAFSRVYLGAHYLSDVLAGMAGSAAWLTICITGISTLRRRREAKSLSNNSGGML